MAGIHHPRPGRDHRVRMDHVVPPPFPPKCYLVDIYVCTFVRPQLFEISGNVSCAFQSQNSQPYTQMDHMFIAKFIADTNLNSMRTRIKTFLVEWKSNKKCENGTYF